MFCVDLFLFAHFFLFYFVTSAEGNFTVRINNDKNRLTRQANHLGCTLPQYPRFGQWAVYKATTQFSPGDVVPSGSVLQVSCKDTYKLDNNAAIVCLNGKWSNDIGQCLKTCPPIFSSSFMTVKCTYNYQTTENCTEAVDGTEARFECADFFEDLNLDRHPVHLCFNGKWSHIIPECVPICGQKSTRNNPTLIVNGTTVAKGDYPWQVALYNISNKELLCGGSLINQRVVLTAAHCIANDQGKLIPKETYMIAVGKYYRLYDHPKDAKEAQFSTIHEMYIPRQFKGDIQNWFGDFAILVTTKIFVLSTRVQPVCIDWGFKYQRDLLNPTRLQNAYVSGWGYTVEYKHPSEELREIQVPLVSSQECDKNLREDYNKYLTDDKLCAGFLNAGTAVCKGDSGGALVAKYGNRFYAIGVVSLSPVAPTPEGGCDSQTYTLFTSVHYYTSLLLEKEARYRPSHSDYDCENDPDCTALTTTVRTTTSTTTTTTTTPTPQTTTSTTITPIPEDSCILPEHPKDGEWTVFGWDSAFSPGQYVTALSVLQISCKKGLELSGEKIVLCQNGTWTPEIGKCLRSCPSLKSTATTEIICSLKGKEVSCDNPIDGTIAKHKCAPFFEDLQLAKNPVRYCRDGSWDLSAPECVPACGRKPVRATPLIVGGQTTKKSDYPWHVAIYKNQNKKFLCGGTLINQKLILTAAHCVSSWNGTIITKEKDYIVAAGKYYREFYDPLDLGAQFSQVQGIFVPTTYRSNYGNYRGDLAVLVAKKPFVISQNVLPACVNWTNSLEFETSLSGFVPGWGFTVPGSTPADELKELEVPLVEKGQCFSALSENFRQFLRFDKLCGGYLNQNKSLCNGDAGSGLVVDRNQDGRYYITGITSVSPVSPDTGTCDPNQYTLFTRVSLYNEFISKVDAKTKEDTSEEEPVTTTTTPKPSPKPKKSCTLPAHPAHGQWSVFSLTSTSLSPGNVVGLGTVLRVTCNERYKLDGDAIILCDNGKWSSNIGKCLRTCTSVSSTPTIKATCIFKGKETENCTDPIEGTQVKYECAPFYENEKLAENPIRVCLDGSWNFETPRCSPVCGLKSVTPQTLIVRGNKANRGDYPWNVAIYSGSENMFICAGSLISTRLILTAAHCVSDIEGVVKANTLFTVAAGKYYSKFNDSRESDSNVQFSPVQHIFVPKSYKGFALNGLANIAILVTPKPLTLSSTVQPICMDWSLKYINQPLESDNTLTGHLPGWGFTDPTGSPAEVLNEMQVPLINFEKCYREVPSDFTAYLTKDKLCAGYLNGTAACKGDSGGGLVVKYSDRYYIVGVLSAGPSSSGRCDFQQYAIYTKISSYIDFIINNGKLFDVQPRL